MRCKVETLDRREKQPSMRMEWIREDNRALNSNAEQRDGVIYIKDVQLSDGGNYRCLVRDQRGKILFTVPATLEISSKYLFKVFLCVEVTA